MSENETGFVDDAFRKAILKRQQEVLQYFGANGQLLFSTPEEYKNVTGHRFRMTKEQRQRGVSREQAFDEFIATLATLTREKNAPPEILQKVDGSVTSIEQEG